MLARLKKLLKRLFKHGKSYRGGPCRYSAADGDFLPHQSRGEIRQMISTVCKTHHHRMTPRSQTRCGFFLPLPRLVCAWRRPREKQDQKARDPERQKVINPTSGNTPEITLTSVGLGPELASPLFLPYPIKVVKYKESLPRNVQEGP